MTLSSLGCMQRLRREGTALWCVESTWGRPQCLDSWEHCGGCTPHGKYPGHGAVVVETLVGAVGKPDLRALVWGGAAFL